MGSKRKKSKPFANGFLKKIKLFFSYVSPKFIYGKVAFWVFFVFSGVLFLEYFNGTFVINPDVVVYAYVFMVVGWGLSALLNYEAKHKKSVYELWGMVIVLSGFYFIVSSFYGLDGYDLNRVGFFVLSLLGFYLDYVIERFMYVAKQEYMLSKKYIFRLKLLFYYAFAVSFVYYLVSLLSSSYLNNVYLIFAFMLLVSIYIGYGLRKKQLEELYKIEKEIS